MAVARERALRSWADPVSGTLGKNASRFHPRARPPGRDHGLSSGSSHPAANPRATRRAGVESGCVTGPSFRMGWAMRESARQTCSTYLMSTADLRLLRAAPTRGRRRHSKVGKGAPRPGDASTNQIGSSRVYERPDTGFPPTEYWRTATHPFLVRSPVTRHCDRQRMLGRIARPRRRPHTSSISRSGRHTAVIWAEHTRFGQWGPPLAAPYLAVWRRPLPATPAPPARASVNSPRAGHTSRRAPWRPPLRASPPLWVRWGAGPVARRTAVRPVRVTDLQTPASTYFGKSARPRQPADASSRTNNRTPTPRNRSCPLCSHPIQQPADPPPTAGYGRVSGRRGTPRFRSVIGDCRVTAGFPFGGPAPGKTSCGATVRLGLAYAASPRCNPPAKTWFAGYWRV